MAYSLKINTQCHEPGCTKNATREVFAFSNESFGKFCDRHSDQKWKELTEAEAQNPAGFRRA